MPMTPAQETLLVNAIYASTDPAVIAARNAADHAALTTWSNAAMSPATLGWRKAVPPAELDDAPNYNQLYTSLSQPQRDLWDVCIRFTRDFSRQRLRNMIEQAWGVAAAANNNPERCLLAGTESITNAQNAIGKGTLATHSSVVAWDRTFWQVLTLDEVSGAMNRNPR